MNRPSHQHELVAVPAPIEVIGLPNNLDGRDGANRAAGSRAQIAADNDIDAIKSWLAHFIDTKTTFDNYRKEAERLLLWCSLERGKPLSSINYEDWLCYREFLKAERDFTAGAVPVDTSRGAAHTSP